MIHDGGNCEYLYEDLQHNLHVIRRLLGHQDPLLSVVVCCRFFFWCYAPHTTPLGFMIVAVNSFPALFERSRRPPAQALYSEPPASGCQQRLVIVIVVKKSVSLVHSSRSSTYTGYTPFAKRLVVLIGCIQIEKIISFTLAKLIDRRHDLGTRYKLRR